MSKALKGALGDPGGVGKPSGWVFEASGTYLEVCGAPFGMRFVAVFQTQQRPREHEGAKMRPGSGVEEWQTHPQMYSGINGLKENGSKRLSP
jgi:hypothetical protein